MLTIKSMDDQTIRAVMSAMGKRGGSKGGKKRWADKTPEERSAAMKKISKLGTEARWGSKPTKKTATKKSTAKKASRKKA
jgi:hypothetical protein